MVFEWEDAGGKGSLKSYFGKEAVNDLGITYR
jgi:hypothetical protein